VSALQRSARRRELAYYFTKIVARSFDETLAKLTDELKKEGFGILTEIDVKETLKNKLNVDFRQYKILGTCNPSFAYRALQAEDKIGILLPCNVIIQEKGDSQVEVSAIDPIETMKVVGNPKLATLAERVQAKLKRVIANI
jgi:uncharacterized protein (DUF302 family)